MITRQKIGGEMLFCVSERGQEVLGTFPTLAQAATVQRFLLGANMSNDAMAFAVHCMQESDKRTEQVSALQWADEIIMQEAAEDTGIGHTRPPVKRRKKKKKPQQPAAVAQAGSGPAERGNNGNNGKVPAAD